MQDKGRVHYQGRLLPVFQALRGQPVGARATATDGLVEVLFCHQAAKRLNLGECSKAEQKCYLCIRHIRYPCSRSAQQ